MVIYLYNTSLFPMKKILYMLFYCLTFLSISDPLLAQKTGRPFQVKYHYNGKYFPLVYKGKAATLFTDRAEADVVDIAAAAWSKDIKLLTSVTPAIDSIHQKLGTYPVIAGTIGRSALIDQLIKSKKISAGKVKGKWETFSIAVVSHPFKNVKRALVIYGSDDRGTAFGLFELSRMLGVSPFYWWADVTPTHHNNLFITPGESIQGPPSVKYRGIFLNDEDWGLRPWAAKMMDPDKKDIGPHTYEKVFELLLRLKANYLWPAMHPGTKAFWYNKDNPALARKYAIIMGSSHHEPMLRNTEFEWNENFKEEYGKPHGAWRYDENKPEIYRFFDDRVKESVNNQAIYTVGMRATKDGAMDGPENTAEKVRILERVITDQRQILTNRLHKPANEIPQVFCPYKEVLPLYQAGLKLPEDIIITWVDDNHGYIRQLPDPKEQQRSGGGGVYYHFSYWGTPEDYLWLCSTSPVLTAYEMNKAYDFNARKMWVFNVGDLKPAEMETQFAMDMAWNIKKWPVEKAAQYAYSWAEETFGINYAKEIAAIKTTYYRLAAAGKPEHVDKVTYSPAELDQRLTDYQQLAVAAEALARQLPGRLQDAYYQLILYPVKGAKLMNEKIFYARQSLAMADAGNPQALNFSKKAEQAYQEIQALTRKYNDTIAGGKWSGMIDAKPRDARVYNMPPVATAEMLHSPLPSRAKSNHISAQIIPAAAYTTKTERGDTQIKTINGLGFNGQGVAVLPFLVKSFDVKDAALAPCLTYSVSLNSGIHRIIIKCLPTFRIYQGLRLRYGISVNHQPIQIQDLTSLAETKAWEANVLRSYTQGVNTFQVDKSGEAIIKIYLLDPGLVINQLEIIAL